MSEIWRCSAVVDVPMLGETVVLDVDESLIDTAGLHPDVDPGPWTYQVERTPELDDNHDRDRGVWVPEARRRVLMARMGPVVSLELRTSGLTNGQYQITAFPEARQELLTRLFMFVIGSELVGDIAVGLARLEDSIGDLVRHSEQLEERLALVLGDLQEAQHLIDVLEAQIKVLKAAAAASRPEWRQRLGRAAVSIVLPIVATAGGFHWSDEQADATDRQTAAIVEQTASNERIAGIDDLEDEFDRKLAQCWNGALRVHSDLEGTEREQSD